MSLVELVQEYVKDEELNIPLFKIKRVTNMVEQGVLNYCNLTEIPQGLEYVVAEMALQILLPKEPFDPTKPNKDIKSMSVARVSYTFDDSRTTSLTKQVDDVVFNYRQQLNEFRTLRW